MRSSRKVGYGKGTLMMNRIVKFSLVAPFALWAGLAAVQASARVAAAQAANPEVARQPLKGHLTPDMLAAPLTRPVPPDTRLTLVVGLVVKDADGLKQTAEAVSDPKSPDYRKYLTPDQVADRFGASPADYQTVLDWAKANGFTAVAHGNRFTLTIEGSVASVETAFNVHMQYRKRPDGTEFFAPDAEPSIKLALPVEHISGLENFILPTHAGGSGSGGGYQGQDYRNAYAEGITLTGAGQSIGIFMDDGFAQSDINGYAAMTHQSYHPVQEVPANTATTPGGEGTLDVEMTLSMAPSAQIVAFLGASTAILTNMTDRKDIKQFTSSWFWYNGNTTDQLLMAVLAVQGQSFFQASGDGGAYPPNVWAGSSSPNLDCRLFPEITIVGGTSLDMSGNGASYGTLETPWSLSSGGIEASVALPSYQSGIAGRNGASSTHRNVPDVAAQAASTNYYFGGAPSTTGGTSQATPLWAGYMALVNELAERGGQPSVGFANPALYALAGTDAYKSNFHDVVSGCTPNGLSGSKANKYCAGTGYDLTTGLGSPKNALIYTLANVQAYPLYCQGPLVTTSEKTPFKWASQGAGAGKPGPGECAWADGPPRGTEIKSGNSNVISGDLHALSNLPAGKYMEIGVFNDPHGHDMVVTQIVGTVAPPFSSTPTLP